DIASTPFAEVRLTISPDGRTALWFSRNRPGGPGDYDIWMSRRTEHGWAPAAQVAFNSSGRDFDPAYSPDGAFVYFSSDRSGDLGGDDLYRVAVIAAGFGVVEHLGPAVNSASDEFAPMLSPDRKQLLFSSDRPGGAGGHDLYTAQHRSERFETAQRLRGDINTAAHEFDAVFLADSATLVFARAEDFGAARVDLFAGAIREGRYDAALPMSINDAAGDTYGPMLDWSSPDRLTFSARRSTARDMDLYIVRYQLPARAP
ncbi:MAG: TolB family protein, partial [Steroidobacter sp.]